MVVFCCCCFALFQVFRPVVCFYRRVVTSGAFTGSVFASRTWLSWVSNSWLSLISKAIEVRPVAHPWSSPTVISDLGFVVCWWQVMWGFMSSDVGMTYQGQTVRVSDGSKDCTLKKYTVFDGSLSRAAAVRARAGVRVRYDLVYWREKKEKKERNKMRDIFTSFPGWPMTPNNGLNESSVANCLCCDL